MGKGIIAIIVSILATGFIAGIFTGASIKSGEDIDPDSQLVKVLGIFCDSLKDSTEAYSTCRLSFIGLSFALIIVGILEILGAAHQLENFWIGLIIYVVGWFLGLILVL